MSNEQIIPGMIFYSSWGYEQTNVNFYQVVAVVGTTSIKIREVSSSVTSSTRSGLYGYVIPNENQFIGEVMMRRVNLSSGKPTLKIDEVARAYLWDGTPMYESSYA